MRASQLRLVLLTLAVILFVTPSIILFCKLAYVIANRPPDEFEEGKEAYNRGDYKTAHDKLLKAAEKGYAPAQFNLGMMYENNEEVQNHDPDAEAVCWYRKAAEQGFAEAQLNLGLMYIQGKGVQGDPIEAYMWINLAAAQGNEKAAKVRESLQQSMNQFEIAEAQERTREWRRSSDPETPSNGAVRRGAGPQETPPRANSTFPDSSGSGFFVSSAGHILTNDHVIAGCAKLQIYPDGGNATIKARDRRNDLALLQTSAERVTRPAPLRSERARVGESAVAAGYPSPYALLGDSAKVTSGIVSALLGPGGDSRHLQIMAPIQSGNSGGPLLDGSGHVLGVVASKLNALCIGQTICDISQNTALAIRAEIARAFLNAHNIPYQNAPTAIALSNEEIAAEARAYTVLIECWK